MFPPEWVRQKAGICLGGIFVSNDKEMETAGFIP